VHATTSIPALHVDHAAALLGPHAEAGQRPSVHARWDPPALNRPSPPPRSRHASTHTAPTSAAQQSTVLPYSVCAHPHVVPRAANVQCLDVCEPPVHRPPLLKSPTCSPRASREPPRAAIEAASASSLLAHSHTRPTPVVAPIGLVGTFPLICCRVPPCSSPEQGSPRPPRPGAADPSPAFVPTHPNLRIEL
jgi:hypothetical protein